jgi:hypothetical protein
MVLVLFDGNTKSINPEVLGEFVPWDIPEHPFVKGGVRRSIKPVFQLLPLADSEGFEKLAQLTLRKTMLS